MEGVTGLSGLMGVMGVMDGMGVSDVNGVRGGRVLGTVAAPGAEHDAHVGRRAATRL